MVSGAVGRHQPDLSIINNRPILLKSDNGGRSVGHWNVGFLNPQPSLNRPKGLVDYFG